MARGPKHHQKRIACPKSWMLGKLGGLHVTRPSQGPHKLRQCIPLSVILKNKLKYALNGRDVTQILRDKEANIKIDGQVRRDKGFPLGVMDLLSIEKTNEVFRILYDVKGRFVMKAVKKEEQNIKLLRVTQKSIGPNKVPYIVTHDARTFRFPNPAIQINDTVRYNISTGKIEDFAKFELGNTAYITQGNNIGRVGLITNMERHPGSFDIVHIRDSQDRSFATRSSNVFVLGKGKKSWISLPKGEGLHHSVLEEKRLKEQRAQH